MNILDIRILKLSFFLALVGVGQTRPAVRIDSSFNLNENTSSNIEPRKAVEYCTRICKWEHLQKFENIEHYNNCLNDCIILNVGTEILQGWLRSLIQH